MNRLFLSLISLAACMTSCTSPEPLTDYVDPRIGTAHSRWFFFTPAAVPFGMAKLAPTPDGHLGNPGRPWATTPAILRSKVSPISTNFRWAAW